MSLFPEILTHELIDRRMREASDARLAATASRNRPHDGHVVRFRGRLGRAIMAFGHALGGESLRAGLTSSRTPAAPSRRGIVEPGC